MSQTLAYSHETLDLPVFPPSTKIQGRILERVRAAKRAVVVAGHYCLAEHMQELSHESEAEMLSFAVGAELVREGLRAGHDSHLVLWVNDIGITELQRTQLRENYALPSNYAEILDARQFDASRLTVMFESAMRNKASTMLRKLYKREPDLFSRAEATREDLVRCVGGTTCGMDQMATTMAYVVEGPEGEQLVVKEGPSPKCNLILATFFTELRRRFAPTLLLNVFNEVYTYRVGLGVHVSQSVLGNPTPILNVFCDGTKVYCGPEDCLSELGRLG